ncbi:MAG: ABC transporter permease subunit [Alphaproteobacteria bacterium]
MTVSEEIVPKKSALRRRAPTRRSVLIIDRLADWTITVGGIFVIVAVFTIMAFLAQAVVPLFTGASIIGAIEGRSEAIRGRALMTKIDEYKTLAVAIDEAGKATAFHIASGKPVAAPQFDFGGKKITAFARTLSGANVAFGFADGTVRFGEVKIDVEVLAPGQDMSRLETLNDHDWTDGRAIYTTIQGGQIRKSSISLEIENPQDISPGQAIRVMDYRIGGTPERPSIAFVTVSADGVARLTHTETRKNMLTGEVTSTAQTSALPELPADAKIAGVLITEKADQIYAAEETGLVRRYDTRDLTKPTLAESISMVPEGARLTSFSFLIGEQSLVVGSSAGTVDVFFRLQRSGATTKDGYALVRAHNLEPQKSEIIAVSASQRSKTFATADGAGNVWLRHSTSEQVLLKAAPKAPVKIDHLVLAPREDGILAITDDGRYFAWDVDAPHPETTISSIFGKVWYEGYQGPGYTWQSSSGTDSFEPKLSLVPLIFGTLKAAFYSMLFAVPIAICAAIYTSEFLHHSVRSVIKPVMEMMASLPSVVLGFIAALILAPIIETWIAAVIMAFIAVPMGLMVGAYLWQMLPSPVALRYGGIPKFILMFAVIALFGWLCYGLGDAFEQALFAGDLKAWANGGVGTDAPFLALLLFPLAFIAAALLFERNVGRLYADWMRGLPRSRAGAMSAARWIGLCLAGAAIAYVGALLMIGLGISPRGGIVNTYTQRNALVVGFAMGFAIIPIIYTIAEDALNSVPEHLRAASLACGATSWQTAIAVILPAAMSGVFAAVMVGMGRAVGETMIVVMAAGNTAILDWNIFNGLRALSANIAVELPEAVKDSTLFRMLFLAALTLFVVTFVINTLAEAIRLRFRRRTAQL